MIPILFDKAETAFTSNGIGRLVDCISCKVTEERNGIYELELQYPITGKWFSELMLNGGTIGAIHDDNHDIQPFDVYKSSAPIDGVVTFNAHHISYRLNNVILKPYSASTAKAAIAGIPTNSVNANAFDFYTDKEVNAEFSINKPQSARSILFGQRGSLLDVYGAADFKFDRFEVQMLRHRGGDSGVTVRYGKNMVAITQERDASGVASALAPFWADDSSSVYLPEYIVGPTTPVTPVVPVVMDMTNYFNTTPTVEELRTAARQYLDNNQPWIVSENIKIDFVALWQTYGYASTVSDQEYLRDAFTLQEVDGSLYLEPVDSNAYINLDDYLVISRADLTNLQRVGLCDTVSVYYTDLGIVEEKAKVERVVYNVLAERFDELELGTLSRSYVAITQAT